MSPLCDVCDGPLHPNEAAHREICAYTLLRDAVIPRFASIVALLSTSQSTPLLGQVRSCETLEALQDLLMQLGDTNNIRSNVSALHRFDSLLLDVSQFAIASEHATFDEHRQVLRLRFIALPGEYRTNKSVSFQNAETPSLLTVVLRDSINHLMRRRMPEEADLMRLLLAEVQRFRALHDEPDPASEQSAVQHPRVTERVA